MFNSNTEIRYLSYFNLYLRIPFRFFLKLIRTTFRFSVEESTRKRQERERLAAKYESECQSSVYAR